MPYSVVAVDDVGCASTLRIKWVHITLYCIAGWPAIFSKASICRWCLMPSEKHQEHQEKPGVYVVTLCCGAVVTRFGKSWLGYCGSNHPWQHFFRAQMILQTHFPLQGKLVCKMIPLEISPPKSFFGTPLWKPGQLCSRN